MERVVIITGGTNGIGLACARKFLGAGNKVVYLGRHQKPEVDAELSALGEAAFVRADVAVQADCEAAVAAAIDRFGRVDVLVNVAGIVGERQAFCDIDLDNVRSVIETNLMGTIYMGRFVAPRMAEQRSGVIVNVGSICGHIANTENIAYHASKGGVTMLTKAEARELAPYGVRAVEVAPGWVHTGMLDPAILEVGGKLHMGGKIVEPEEVADLIYLAASPEASCWNGTCVMADNGYSAFKGLDGHSE